MNDEKNNNQKEQIRAVFAGLVRAAGCELPVFLEEKRGMGIGGQFRAEEPRYVVEFGENSGAEVQKAYELFVKLQHSGVAKGAAKKYGAVSQVFQTLQGTQAETGVGLCDNMKMIKYADQSIGLAIAFPEREAGEVIGELNKAQNNEKVKAWLEKEINKSGFAENSCEVFYSSRDNGITNFVISAGGTHSYSREYNGLCRYLKDNFGGSERGGSLVSSRESGKILLVGKPEELLAKMEKIDRISPSPNVVDVEDMQRRREVKIAEKNKEQDREKAVEKICERLKKDGKILFPNGGASLFCEVSKEGEGKFGISVHQSAFDEEKFGKLEARLQEVLNAAGSEKKTETQVYMKKGKTVFVSGEPVELSAAIGKLEPQSPENQGRGR